MSTQPADYTVRAYTDADLPAVLRLLERALGPGPTGRRSEAFFRWKHEANPFGASIALVADLDGQVIGFRTFMRWTFRAGDRTYPAVRAVDTATDPDHQGRGIFRRLTLAGLDLVRPQAAFVFNTPNAQSLPGYLKFGWQTVGDVPLQVRVARPFRFARHARAALRARGASTPVPADLPTAADALADTDAVEALLAAQPPDDRLHTAHTVASLRWRYADAPDLGYRAIAVRDGRDLAALGIGRLRSRGPLTELTLAETLVRPGDPNAARALLRAAARTGADHVIAHLAPATLPAAVARRAGYLPAPGQGITLVIRPLADDTLGTQRAHWRLSLGVLEVF